MVSYRMAPCTHDEEEEEEEEQQQSFEVHNAPLTHIPIYPTIRLDFGTDSGRKEGKVR